MSKALSNDMLNLSVNCVLHACILFTIIGGFYFLFVSKIAANGFKSTIQKQIDNIFKPLENRNLEQIKKYIKPNEQVLDKIIDLYDKPTETTKTQNDWIKRVYLLVIVFLLFIVILIVSLFKIFCHNVHVDIGHIIFENIVFFMLVGCVEIMFFLKIGMHYIPSKPSLLLTTILDSMKKSFE